MAGRFPLYTDNDGDLVKALRRTGPDVIRGIDTFPKGTLDPKHFEKADVGRVLVTNDQPLVDIAHQWLEAAVVSRD